MWEVNNDKKKRTFHPYCSQTTVELKHTLDTLSCFLWINLIQQRWFMVEVWVNVWAWIKENNKFTMSAWLSAAVIGLILSGSLKQRLSVHIGCNTSNPIKNITLYSAAQLSTITAPQHKQQRSRATLSQSDTPKDCQNIHSPAPSNTHTHTNTSNSRMRGCTLISAHSHAYTHTCMDVFSSCYYHNL